MFFGVHKDLSCKKGICMAEEKVYTIPLRKAFRKAHHKRVPYATRLVRSYLQTHMKTENVKLGSKLNDQLWERSIGNPPRKVRVKAVREGNLVRAELMGHDYVEFKAKPKTEKKDAKEKLLERLGPKAMKKAGEEKQAEGTKAPEKAKPVEKHVVGEGE